jgi:hypothetical protein
MRTKGERRLVDFVAGQGRNASEVARLTGIPRSTVRDWLRQPALGDWSDETNAIPEVPGADYAYLLGMYLGDGHISRSSGARCYRLRITADALYPGVIAECAAAMRAVVPSNRVSIRGRTDGERAVEISAYSKAWPQLFPQHGPGKKHMRRIVLASWQEDIVQMHPQMFLRGLLHSDGCRVLNRVNGKIYPRYFFTQISRDIRELFCRTCDELGIVTTSRHARQVSVARAKSVTLLDSFVGAKA